MKYMHKKIFNVFGGPGGVYADGGRQISPVIQGNGIHVRSGAWVLNNNNSNCSTNCANNCANNGRTYPELRRALFASPIPDNKMKVLPNSAGLCNQTKYGQIKEGQNHRISFDAARIMASKPSNCRGAHEYVICPTGNRIQS